MIRRTSAVGARARRSARLAVLLAAVALVLAAAWRWSASVETATDDPARPPSTATGAYELDALVSDLERPADVVSAAAASRTPSATSSASSALPAVEITVTVRDRRTKQPIAGAEVVRAGARVYTDASGVAAFASPSTVEGAPVGRAIAPVVTATIFHVRAKGYTEAYAVQKPDDGPAARFDVELEPVRVVRGRVVDSAHVPVAGASVRLQSDTRIPAKFVSTALTAPFADASARTIAEPRSLAPAIERSVVERTSSTFTDATSGADGRFELHDVPAGARLVLRALHATRGAGVLAPGGFDDGEPEIDVGDVRLEPLRRIAGRVVTRYPDESGGEPVDGGVVQLVSMDLGVFSGRAAMRAVREPVTTLADGRFAFDGLLPVRYELSVRGAATEGDTEIGLVDAAEKTDVELVIPRTKSLQGVVVDASGAPLRGARLTARGKGVAGSAITDADGRFEVKGLGVKPVELEVVPSGLSRGVLRTVVDGLLPGEREVRVQVQSSAAIAGVVLGASDEPLAFAGVTAVDASGREAGFTYADADGRFELAVREGERFDLVAQPSKMKTESVRTLDRESDARARSASVWAGTSDVVLRMRRAN